MTILVILLIVLFGISHAVIANQFYVLGVKHGWIVTNWRDYRGLPDAKKIVDDLEKHS